MLRKILILNLLVLSLAGICFADMEKVQKSLIGGDLSAAEKECQSILSGNPASTLKEEAQFYSAAINLKKNNYLEARRFFNLLIHDFPQSKFLNRVRLGISDSYLAEGNLSLAEKIYEELLGRKDNEIAPTAYARLIELNLKAGNREKAQDYLNRLHASYPLSFEAGMMKGLPSEVKKEVSEEISPAKTTDTTTEFYTVQVGAFVEQSRADKLCKELIQKGEDAYVVFLESPVGQSLYRVRVGRVTTQKEAEVLAKKLSSLGYPTKVIP